MLICAITLHPFFFFNTTAALSKHCNQFSQRTLRLPVMKNLSGIEAFNVACMNVVMAGRLQPDTGLIAYHSCSRRHVEYGVGFLGFRILTN